MILMLDRLLTETEDPQSYITTGLLNGGSRFQFDLRPWGQKFAYYYRSWEPDYISVLRSLYPGGWFVDIGSSLGLYVVCMADEVRRHGGRIASVEPVPFNLARQHRNVELNGVADLVEYARVAVGATPSRAFLSADATEADNNAFIATNGTIETEVVTLDSLARDRNWSPIGAIKMDVEGYEPEVIAGARQTIDEYRPVVLAEFNRERMTINGTGIEESWQFFRQRGYEAWVLESGRLRRLDQPGLHENLFFVPEQVLVPATLRLR